MRSIVGVALVLVCLFLSGCQTPGGKKKTTAAPTSKTSQPRTDFPDTIPSAIPAARSDRVKGLLAGRVMDKYRRQIPEAEIEVVDLQEANLKKAAPLDVTTDAQGYFTIQGLEVGHNYRLVARAREGSTILSGTTFAVATNSRVSVFVSEDFTTPETTPPRGKGTAPDKKTDTLPETSAPAASLGNPKPAPPDATKTGSSENSTINKSQIADGVNGFQKAPSRPGVSGIPGAERANINTAPEDPGPKIIPPTPGSPSADSAPPRNPGTENPDTGSPSTTSATARTGKVPSCVVLAKKLQRLTMNDLDGETWDYERDLKEGTRAKALMLVFGDYGKPEMLALIQPIQDLQKEFRKQGLEVVSVAYDLTDFKNQSASARLARSRYQIKFRMCLGSGSLETCPVAKQFDLSKVPTVVLIGDDGRIIGDPFVTFDDREMAVLRHELVELLERKR